MAGFLVCAAISATSLAFYVAYDTPTAAIGALIWGLGAYACRPSRKDYR